MSTVTGTNDPATDAAAVQAAVDAGGTVKLRGTFSFEGLGSSTTPVITITRSVRVIGIAEDGQPPRIQRGERPFFINAPGADVSIAGLHFERPLGAINARAAERLAVTRCRFEMVDRTPITLAPRNTDQFGMVKIADNVLHNNIPVGSDVGQCAGITLLASEDHPGRMVKDKLTISGNEISDFTANYVSVISAGCDTKIVGNHLTMAPRGRSGKPGSFVQGIRVAGPGDYKIEDNVIECAHANAAAIRLGGTTDAVAQGNSVHMSVPASVPDTALNANMQSAGIVVEGTASGNVIRGNLLTGRARVAMSVIHTSFAAHTPTGSSGNPERTTFRENDATGFTPSFHDAEVGIGFDDRALPPPPDERRPIATVFAGPSGLSLDDEGVGTVSIEWDPPANIVAGTPLSSAQLDAAANRPGTITYSPPAGTVLGPGEHVLALTFTPSEPACAALFPSGIDYSVRLVVE